MQKVKLIAFDLDGTILEPEESIPKDARATLAKASRCGIKLTTATGRPLDDQLRILKNNELGACSCWPHALIANESQIYLLYEDGYKPLDRRNLEVHEGWMKVLPLARKIIHEEFARLKQAGISVQRNISDEVAEHRNMIDLWFNRVEDAQAFAMYLSKRLLNEETGLMCNRNFRLVQILHPIAGKGNTIFVLTRYFGLEPEEVLVIGDSENDVNMTDCRCRFHLATVSNAEPKVKETVTASRGYIASQPVSRGVIEILEKTVFDDECR